MKNKIVLLFILVSISFYSQTKQGKITYKVFLDKNNENSILKNDKIPESQKQAVLSIVKNTTFINCILDFKGTESLFYIQDGLKDSRNSILEISIGKDIVYTNIGTNKEIIVSKETLGQSFLVTENFVNWKLLNESKKINGYNCFKAISQISIDTRNGPIKKNIIAWYTSEINIPFGPKKYNNLPGLILELHEGSLIYQATKIDLDKKTEIKKPLKGKKITAKELNQMFKKLYNERKGRRG